MLPADTDVTTTELEPIRAPSPISIGPKHLGAGADDHVAPQGGMTLALLPAGTAQGYAVVEGAVVADDSGLADHDAHAVIDEETPPMRAPG